MAEERYRIMTDRIARMAEFVKSNQIYPQTCKPEYNPYDLFYPDPISDAKKIKTYLENQTVFILPDDHFIGRLKFDGSVVGDLFTRSGHKRYQEISQHFYKKPQENLCTFEYQHSTADFKTILSKGMTGILADIASAKNVHKGSSEKIAFLEALEIVSLGILRWAEKCATACEHAVLETEDPSRIEELNKMAEILRRVPRYPASNFREAIQSVYFCFHFLPDSLGTPDRYLYPYYQHDIERGMITPDDAKEMIQELFIMINGFTAYSNTWSADKGAESHFSIGGYTEDHKDGFNGLSRLILDAMMDVPIYRPQVSLRWTPLTPHDVLQHVLDCERYDHYKRIAIVNDVPRIHALMNISGLSYEDAINYTMVGCNEPAIQGSIYFGGCTCNAARSLERTLYEYSDELVACKNFEEVYHIYLREFNKDVQRILIYANGFNTARAKDINLVSSLFMDGSIEQAKSVIQGGGRVALAGITLMGIISIIDSLTVIKQFVFEEKCLAMGDLLHILESNWSGFEDIHNMIYKRGKFFGNNDPLSDDIAQRFTSDIYHALHDKTNNFGIHFLVGCLSGYVPHYVWFGKGTKATPDGRCDGDAFMVGAGQTGGKDREGLTALLNSVAKMDPTGILAGPFVCNVMLDEVLIRDDKLFAKTVDLIESYFKNGGLHVQLNYVSKDELLDARKNPHQHRNLRVRVSGFSAYYTLLDVNIQDDIIRRTTKSR